MRLAMAQMKMSKSPKENFEKTKNFIKDSRDCDLIFFPEVQLSPFFAQYRADNTPYNVKDYITPSNAEEIKIISSLAKENSLFVSPNFYFKDDDGKLYDTSFFIDKNAKITGKSKMVNVDNNQYFYEKDYYTPSDGGFNVFNTPFGRIGIIICYDRHFEESFKICAGKEADLIIIPTANTLEEDMDFFEEEIITAAEKNNVNIAMCNRVGKEGDMTFAGQSLIVSREGKVLLKSDENERLIKFSLDL